eukprot:2278225-Ditylum_brightwellii.AAC.1
MSSSNSCGIALNWDYTNRILGTLVSKYIPEQLHKYKQSVAKLLWHKPYPTPEQNYDKLSQGIQPPDTSPSISISN